MDIAQLEGETLAGRFRIHELIGEGGYGAVFRACQLSVDRPVALKILAPKLVSDDHTVERFRIEAQTTSRLTHPNTVVLYDFGQDEEHDVLFLAMELLEGESLGELLGREGPLGVAETAAIVEQAAGSLQEAHRAGMVHRDVKPHNIMLVERGEEGRFVKVIDFGIAKALQAETRLKRSLTQTGMMIGTPTYMAPEQIRASEVTARTDQYALATCAYRMLAGRAPFENGTSLEIASRHLTESPMPLRSYRPELEVSEAVENVLLKALAKEPEARFETISAFAEAMGAALEGRREGVPDREELEVGEGRADEEGGATEETRQALSEEWTEATRAVDGWNDGEDEAGSTAATARVAREEVSGSGADAAADSEGETWASATKTLVEDGQSHRWLVGLVGMSAVFFLASIVAAIAVNVGGGGSGSGAASEEGGGAMARLDAGAGRERSAVSARPEDVGGRESADGEVGSADVAKADVAKADVAKADVAKADVAKVDVAKVDVAPASEPTTVLAVPQAGRVGPEPPAGGGASVETDTAGSAAAEEGRLTVHMIPWGTLFVDGREVGSGTKVSVSADAGRRRVVMKQNGSAVARRAVRLRAGRETFIELVAP